MIIQKAVRYLQWMADENKKNKSVSKIYDQLANNRENNYDVIIDYPLREKAFEKALHKLDIKPKKVLDIACGTGAMTEAIYKTFKCDIVAVDISSEMIDVAKRRLKMAKSIIFIHDDIFNLDFREHSFDLITIGFATRYISKSQEAEFTKRINKWLKKDGIFLAVIMETPLKDIFHSLSKSIGIKGSINYQMNTTSYFTNVMKKKIPFLKKVFLYRQYLFYKNMGLYFKHE